MKRSSWILTTLTAVGILWIGCGGSSPNEPEPTDTIPITWVSSSVVYDTLIDKKDHSLIYFGAEWCGWCQKLEHETFVNPTVGLLIDESFNAVKINVDADSTVICHGATLTCSELAEMYGATALPTVVFFDRRGQPVGSVVGYRPAGDFAAILRTVRDGG